MAKKTKYPEIKMIRAKLEVTPETLEENSRACFWDNPELPEIKKTFMALAKK